MNKLKLKQMLEAFFIEDIGESDITSESLFEKHNLGKLQFLAKENGVFCGKLVIEVGFSMLDSNINIDVLVNDGEMIEKGQLLAVMEGRMSDLLTGERVVLNLVQRMSGIATAAKKASSILEGTETRACDTRKTTPGLRMLEKYAVRTGGAFNHRIGLYDAVMIKDNHIDFAGGIANAVSLVKSKIGHTVKVEVETETREQVLEAVEAGADIIMFDNRSPVEIKELLKLVPSHIITEASGGINLTNLASYRDCGVDYISLGSLTHSVKSLDISAKVFNQETVKL
ncbi:carboxylating nicotinate-nucleotide diphosphorylase [Peribacillus alkalitolerans]|uniref:carboxylating nicotinate-nucleotide diphosphorylase n=1 Tax=Peribacillus alkalitolerans TaxID=1550385 RepID=UPI0013D047C6|nr:carboxylating nicotinate-nucleotide diphosphorylase [Peribacillus alkalitolerans]